MWTRQLVVMGLVGCLSMVLIAGESQASDCSACWGKAAGICRDMTALSAKLESGEVKRTAKLNAEVDKLVLPIAGRERCKGNGQCADALESALASITGRPLSGSTGGLSELAWQEPITGMQMVWVPRGCYKMGCGPWTADCEDDEKPVHEVCVDGFWMGKYEVTQGEWVMVMGDNPSAFPKGDRYPVEQVSWEDAKQFIFKLNSMNNGEFELRLPTEAEWEYACRSGGKAEKYAGGHNLDPLGCYDRNSASSTHMAGAKMPNGLGIYDMTGNVWEWCEDAYSQTAYKEHPRGNPMQGCSGWRRVVRGGSWLNCPKLMRCSHRNSGDILGHHDSLGFRLVRSP